MLNFVKGILATLAVLFALVAVLLGLASVGADVKPSSVERWVATAELNTAVARHAKGLQNPISLTDDNLLVGMRLYHQHCASCHGISDGQPAGFAQGFYIKAPQFATNGVENDPENVIFWEAAHGIRFTAMPAFKNTMPDEDLWKITMFLKRMDKLPSAVDAAWKKLPSATPAI